MGNKGLIITLIILLSILVFGLVMFLVLALNGNLSFGMGLMGNSRRNKNIIFDNTYALNEIDEIEILLAAGDVNFEKSTDERVRVVICGKNSEDVKVDLNSSKLKIDYSQYKRAIFGFNLDINDITVYIPDSFENKIAINNDYGNCKVCDLENATIEIDADCGNIEIGKIKTANLKCDYGNIEVENVLNKCDIKANCGNVKIKSLEIKENSHIRCDLGDVKIGSAKDVYIDAKVDLGDVKIPNNNRHADVTLNVQVDCGNIKVEE